MKKLLILMASVMLVMGFAMSAAASYLEGGDAADQASADVVLDIVFAADTSASMSDEIAYISGAVNDIVANLECPECDVWVRAKFMNIIGYPSGSFNESITSYVNGAGGTPVSNHQEDNGPAVTDLVNWYDWNDDTTIDQDYYMAIVTIGDEGTENGYPSDQADWDAAYVANQAAYADDIMVFSLVGTPWPSYTGNQVHRDAVFTAMAEGGAGGGYTFDATGGLFYLTTSETLGADLEEIICTAASGGTTPSVPEPATILLLGSGLISLGVFGRKKFFKK